MPRKTFVCLANSFKNGARCVAGIERIGDRFGAWIRPVSHRAGRGLNFDERTYANGTDCALLDVIEADFDAHAPDGYQSENWLITEGSQWRKVGTINAADVAPVFHNGNGPLWPHTGSTGGGVHDKIAAINLGGLTNSLALVNPALCEFSVIANPRNDDRLDVRAIFTWGGQQNNLKVTDPEVCRGLQARGAGRYTLENPKMCISVGEVFDLRNEAYKLVASVFQ